MSFEFDPERLNNLKQLLDSIENTISCIHFTKAVDYCIALSIEDPYNYEGHFDMEGFNNGKYDTDELLESTFETASQLFEDQNNGEYKILEYLKLMNKEKFALDHKYVNGLVKYLNSGIKRIKRKEE